MTKVPLTKIPAGLGRYIRKQSQPEWVAPMLATLTDEHFSDPNWVFECKLDGVRCLVFRQGKSARLMSRNQKIMNNAFPELQEAIEQQPREDFIVDGEIVTFSPGAGGSGGPVTSFARLQNRIHISDPRRARALARQVPVYLYLFDILHVEGHDVTRLPLLARKKLLQQVIQFRGLIRYSEHIESRGEKFLAEACKQGWEGLIAKRADSPYVHSRSRDWLKFKCVNEQEFVIIGYTDPGAAGRVGFGALLLGYYDDHKRLHYAGKVGTGFTDQLLRDVSARLSKMVVARSPLSNGPLPKLPGVKGAHWVSPRLVAQIGFTEWTRDGRLRHPRFLGLRTDKSPKAVVREEPVQ